MTIAPMVGMILVVAACGSSEDDASPATTVPPPAPTTTTATTEAPTTTVPPTTTKLSDDAAVAVVVSAIEAKNNFDFDGWLAAFEGGKRQGIPLFAERILMNADERWEIIEPCQATGAFGSGGTIVECLIRDTTSFWGVGGFSDTKRQRNTVNSDGLITNSNHFGSAGKNAFNRAFHQWLSDTYPDVYEEVDPGFISSNGPGFDARNPDHMLVAVEYVEEFVAQSENYPLDPEDQ